MKALARLRCCATTLIKIASLSLAVVVPPWLEVFGGSSEGSGAVRELKKKQKTVDTAVPLPSVAKLWLFVPNAPEIPEFGQPAAFWAREIAFVCPSSSAAPARAAAS